ncbi:DNA primase [Larsenimonas rhizosphaerae]|uniref:DNA primase n=1 Tax=Larsenimonas rhizosphaerae TaxID=2944682 RepID=A0AA42CWQ0_9GAMM|nr:DNA primase [Larsenimonas rhizosphaerae]MCX2522878.1 DNA primase [Larsenimonas rhizosphaerae]
MAGQISQRFIDDLLARADVVELVNERVVLKKAGRNFQGLCPFHDEKSPSFTVSPDKQFYHCFGCGAHGNAVRFLMEYDGLRFPEAVEQLAARFGLDVQREDDDNPVAQEKAREKKRQQEESEHVLEIAARYYRYQLTQQDASAAREYLARRGLSDEVIRRYGIGFAPDSWDGLKHTLAQRNVAEDQQVEYGLLVEKEGTGRTYDRFRDRVMFPIRDWKGRTLGFGGRVLGDARPKYLNSPETPVFHKGRELYGLFESRKMDPRAERLLIVEGYMDVVALAQFGVNNAVATLGTSTTPEHLQRLFRLVSEIVFCFDGDKAGRQAAVRALSTVLPHMLDGRQARFLFLPEGEDPDSLIRAEGAERFEERVVCASPLSEFLFEQAAEGLDLKQIESRERFVSKVLAHVRDLPDGVLRSLMIEALAERSGIERSRITALLPDKNSTPSADTGNNRNAPAQEEARLRSTSSSRAGLLDRCDQALLLLLHAPESVNELPESVDWCPETASGQLLSRVIRLIRAGGYRSAQVIMGHFHGSEEGEQLRRLLSRRDLLLPPEYRSEELRQIVAHFERRRESSSPHSEYEALVAREKQGEKLSRDDAVRMWQLAQQLSQGKG